MIKVFGQTDKTFSSNGDVVLNPIKARVHKADNGDFYLDLETGLEYIDYFTEGNIVVANTPQGDQAFRIGNVTKSKSKLVSKCYHVFYDSKNYLIADSYVVDKNCNEALAYLNSATEPQSEFLTISDIAVVDSYRCVRKSLYEAIQTILERWGGHLVRDNFTISILSQIGTDNGIIIQYKKNLKDITCQYNWDDVVTKLLPVGKDGLLLNAVNPNADIYITSSTQYSLPYTKTVSFSQDDIKEEDYQSKEAYTQALVDDLRTQATNYLSENCIPKVNYTLSADLDRVTDIGDTIKVIDDRLGIDLLTNVIGFEYDCIFEKYIQVEFGNFTKTLSNLISTVSSTASETAKDEVLQVIDGIYVPAYPQFEEATTRSNINTGENYKTIFGKIKKFFSDLKTVAFSGDYDDLTNKPTIPDAQVNSDWNATSGVAEILNKPTIPTVNDGTLTIKQGGTTLGTFTANQSGNTNINIPSGITYSAGDGIDITSGTIKVDTAFSQASTRTNIASGDLFATILGKIKKYFADLKTVAFSGDYDDLTNKPTIPDAQVNSDWNATSGVAEILNKPTIPNQPTVTGTTLVL